MRLLRIGTVLVFIVTLVLFCAFYVKERNDKDYTIPEIQIESEILNISIHDTEECLMKGVTAYDEKDGDLTAQVMIESISKFTKDQSCLVTYAVMDRDQHVAKNTRMICYTDYVAPTFYLKQPMIFRVDDKVDIRAIVGATDCIEGDISDKVTILATDYVGNTAGVFSVSLQATNKLGDIIYLDLPIYVEQNNVRAPQIELSEYLIHVKKGESPVFEDYVKGVFSDSVEMSNYGLMISTNFDCNTPGTYSVHYHVEGKSGQTGHSILTVIVGG